MTLMQLFNLGPGHADAGRLAASGRGRAMLASDMDFSQALQQSHERQGRKVEPASSRSSREDATPLHTAEGDRGWRGTTTRPTTEGRSAPADPARHADTDQAAPTADGVPASNTSEQTPRESPSADAPTLKASDTAASDQAASGRGKGSTGDDETLAELVASLRQWLGHGSAEGGETLDEASLEAMATLAEMLMQSASPEAVEAALAQLGSAGDELTRMMQQLATQGGRTPQMADPLATLMVLTPSGGRGQINSQMNGQSTADGLDLGQLLGTGDGESSSDKGTKLTQVMSALSSMLDGGQAKAGAEPGSAIESLLTQLATATATAKGGSHTAGSELLSALAQAGPTSMSTSGPAVANPLGQAAGLASAGDADGQANAARLARAMQGAVNQGGGTLTLRMTPAEMGTVRIQLQVQAGTVNAALHAESEGARTLLSQQLSQLRQALESQGLHVERLSVQSMNSNNSANASQQGESDATPNDGRSRDEYRGSQQQQNGEGHDDDSHRQRPGSSPAFEQALDDAAVM